MPEEVELSHLLRDRSAVAADFTGDVLPQHTNESKALYKIKRKLISYLLCEIAATSVIIFQYSPLRRANPLMAPMLLSALTAALAQSINQYQRKRFNFSSLCKFVVWGVINGTLTELWYDMLRTQFGKPIYRVLVDQAVGAPAFQMIFNMLSSLWETGEIGNIFLASGLRALKYSYYFWPLFSVCGFMVFPQEVMFPAYCCANLVWNLILSRVLNKAEKI